MATDTSTSAHGRREFDRYEHRVPVQILARTPGRPLWESTILPGTCRNVSRGGICVVTDKPFHQPAIHVRFSASAGVYVSEPATIVRSLQRSEGSWEHGIRFASPLPEHLVQFLDPTGTLAASA